MSLKKNVFANYLGQGWTALMGLAFVPLYIKYLGMEAYGLIGVFAILQAWLTLLDMGMTPTLGRELARFTTGAHTAQSIHNLLRSLEILCVAVAVLMVGSVWAVSGWLADAWLRADKLPTAVVAQAIAIMAIVIALRFVESVYRSALIGLQKQVWYNAANAAIATLRSLGAIAVLAWVSPSAEAFFLWQAFVSLLTVIILAMGVRQNLPAPPTPPVFSTQALTGVWGYARGMALITLLSLLLTQVDKVLLSRLLSLDAFGIYTLAATVSGALYMVITPITTAIYPRFVELSSRQESAALISTYHQGAQFLTVLTAPMAIVLALFGEGVLFTWSGDASLAHAAGPILSLLALGTFLNGLMFLPYHLQLAYGWTSLTIKINTVAVVLLIPAILWAVPLFGAVAAAWVWVLLNMGYLLVGAQLMHRKLLRNDKWNWYIFDLLLPVSGASIFMLLIAYFKPQGYFDRWHWLGFLLCTLLLGMVGACLSSTKIRPRILTIFRGPCPDQRT